MQVLLVAATAFEIAPFTQWIEKEQVAADVLVTGIGLMATTWSLSRQLSIKKYDLVVQAGIAGCFDQRFRVGDTVVVKKDRIADLGVLEQNSFKDVFDMKLAKPSQFPFRNGWLVNNSPGIAVAGTLKKINAVSVNRISTGKTLINKWNEKYSPVIESMEGAAFHYCCLMAGVPFLQIRSISNYAGERNKSKWNIKESVANLNDTLIKIFRSL